MSDGYQTLSAIRDKITPNHYAYIEQVLKEKVKGMRVLELGCAEGFICYLAKKHGAKTVTGVDHISYRIETAQLYIDDVKFICASIQNKLGLLKDKDIIIASRSLYYLEDKDLDKLFKKIKCMVLIRGRGDHQGKLRTQSDIATFLEAKGFKAKILKDDWVIGRKCGAS